MKLVYMTLKTAISLAHVNSPQVSVQVGLGQYSSGEGPPNYPVPARVYHFDGDAADPPNSVLSNGDVSSIWWQVGATHVTRFV